MSRHFLFLRFVFHLARYTGPGVLTFFCRKKYQKSLFSLGLVLGYFGLPCLVASPLQRSVPLGMLSLTLPDTHCSLIPISPWYNCLLIFRAVAGVRFLYVCHSFLLITRLGRLTYLLWGGGSEQNTLHLRSIWGSKNDLLLD